MLQAKELSYYYRHTPLINQITLQFLPGHVYAIIGPNGAGKTTFLKTLAGIWTPTSGQVLWEGEDLIGKERKEVSKTLTLVSQQTEIFFDFTVREVVSMGRYSHFQLDTEKESPLIDWALEVVDLAHMGERSVMELSSGERQRVFIARALVTESPVLLLDEPTVNLDIAHQRHIWELLQTLKRQGKLVIVATHDLNAVQHECHEVAVIYEGQCVSCGPYEDVVTEALLEAVFGVLSL